MSKTGFQLVRLALTGPKVHEAEVRFAGGLNVVTGPSDTGKTFILQCIDYMLGAKEPPKPIPEAAPYDTVVLDIKARSDGREMALQRGLRGGAFTLSVEGEEDRTLREQHRGESEDTLSHLLLDLVGLAGKVVRKNKLGVTRSLSFRDLAHLTIISEEDIIRTASPILSGQYSNATVEKSVFRLILSGQDDSSVVATEDPRSSHARIEAKEEVIQQLIEQTQQKIDELGIETDLQALRDQIEQITIAYREASGQLSEIEQSAAAVEQRRRSIWTRLRKIESRLDVLGGLNERFQLLERQYQSDLRRLEAIAEAGSRLGELKVERCPVCGALPEDQDEEHQHAEGDPSLVSEACIIEAEKIRSLLADLKITQQDVIHRMTDLEREKLEREPEFIAAVTEISERLRPRMQEAGERIRRSQEQREGVHNAIVLLERMGELNGIMNEVTGDAPEVLSMFAGRDVGPADIEAFCADVEERLKLWNFPERGRVTFSESDWDIDIGGRTRTGHGKGVRAVTHAAFTLALLTYCRRRQLPHPAVVVIDSPLVVYRAPAPGEEDFPQDVKASFFRDLATNFADSQVIILENEDVPGDLAGDAGVNVIRFTKTSAGRYGFLASSP